MMNAYNFKKFLEGLHYEDKTAIYNARNKYYSSQGYTKDDNVRKGYFIFVSELLDDMLHNESSSVEEIERAILFGYIVLDSRKYKMSVQMAKEDLGIQELYDKYVLEIKED